MIDFHKIEVSDVKRINSYINEKYLLVDYNPICIYIWSNYYKTLVAYDDEFTYIKLDVPNVGICYLPPIGNGDYNKAICNIEVDAKENGYDLIFTCIDDLNNVKLESIGYKTYESKDDFNYIYLANDLAFYEGNKFKAKRNLVNKFEKTYPHVFYRNINKNDLNRIISFVEEWRISNKRELDDSYYAQLEVINKMLVHLDDLNIVGVMLEDGKRIYGIALGSVIGNVAYEHIELALADCKGAYQEVLQCFARTVSLKCEYINREEDLGIEALRESKLSYNPIKLERFYTTLKR